MRFVAIDLSSSRSSIDEGDYTAHAIARVQLGGLPHIMLQCEVVPAVVSSDWKAPAATNLVTFIFFTEKNHYIVPYLTLFRFSGML
jgi:hypothetical protein